MRSFPCITHSVTMVTMSAFLALAQPTGGLAERFKQLDRNGDGKVSREEGGSLPFFDAADKNKDGFVTFAEAEARARQSAASARNRTAGMEGDGAGPVTSRVKPVEVLETESSIQTLDAKAADGRAVRAFWRKPKGDGPFPAIVFIHGGLTQFPEEVLRRQLTVNPVVTRMLAAGYAVVQATFRTYEQDVQSLGPIEDVRAVVHALARVPEVDARRIALFGGSGGGSIALELGGDSAVRAIVAGEPATVLYTGMLTTGEYGPRLKIMAEPEKYLTPELRARTLEKLKSLRAPVLILHSDQHDLHELNGPLFVPLMKEAGVKVEYREYPGYGHGFYFGGADDRWGKGADEAVVEAVVRDVRAFLDESIPAAAPPRPAGGGLAERFKQLERNGDGKLDRGELPSLLPPVVARGTPEEIARFRSAAEYSHEQAGLVLLILRDGEVVFEQHVAGSSPERAYQIASGTKSFWGPAAMAAIEDGLFTLDEHVADTLTEWKTDPRKSQITVRHLLSFSSGLDSPRRLWAERGLDKGKFALERPAVADPGTKWSYSEVHLYAFGEFFRRKLAAKQPAGKAERPFDYLERNILKPIGLHVTRWKRESNGDPAMGDGAVLTAREWAKFGELLRQEGVWENTKVLPADRLALCFQSSPANQAYGLTWWLNKELSQAAASLADTAGAGRIRSSDQVSKQGICPGHLPDLVMAAGAGQQRLFVIPSERMVIVRFANENMPQTVMAGDYAKLRLDFRDDEFFARLFAWGTAKPK